MARTKRSTARTHDAGAYRTRPFGAVGHEGCCLWCGKAFPERRDRMLLFKGYPIPKVGDARTVMGHQVKIRDAEYYRTDYIPPQWGPDGETLKGTGKNVRRKVKATENPDCVYLTYTPSVYKTINPKDDVGLFCEDGLCALAFAMTTAQLGYRLHATPQGAKLEHVKGQQLTEGQRKAVLAQLAGGLDWVQGGGDDE